MPKMNSRDVINLSPLGSVALGAAGGSECYGSSKAIYTFVLDCGKVREIATAVDPKQILNHSLFIIRS
ncbi:MAG: hypothetical protein ACJAX5_000714 [Patiriisocius sp.]